MFTYRNVYKLVDLDKNNINNSRSQQSNVSIQSNKMKWTETKYLPGLRIMPSSIAFNFDNMNQELKITSVGKNSSWTELSQLKLNYSYDAMLNLEL